MVRDGSPVPQDPFHSSSEPLSKNGWIRAAHVVFRPEYHSSRTPFVASTPLVRARAATPPLFPSRPLSPSELPGVRAIPRHLNLELLREHLEPGLYYAKSMNQYLGPFDNVPTAVQLPAGEHYVLLQRMGRMPTTGKSVFRQVGQLDLT